MVTVLSFNLERDFFHCVVSIMYSFIMYGTFYCLHSVQRTYKQLMTGFKGNSEF